MNEYTMCSRCNEKPAAICISCITECFAAGVDVNTVFETVLNLVGFNDLLKVCESQHWLLGVMVEEGYLKADYDIKKLAETAIAKSKQGGEGRE